MPWPSDVLELNKRPIVTTKRVGEGKHKVVIVDDFYAHPEQVLELARGLYFLPNQGGVHGNFPGRRAFVSLDTQPLIQALSAHWGEPLESHAPYQPVVFSTIKNAADQVLNVDQRMPHIDPGVSAMVYLNQSGECHGGTGIYRHVLTGLERVPHAVNDDLRALAAGHGYHPARLDEPDGLKRFEDAIVFNPLFAAKENRYIDDGNEFWELLYLVKMRFNRLVIFDGRMPHSQHLSLEAYRDTVRLNQILYLKGHD
ncbi:MAG: DUF6445 family protein [Planctomycetota bacterium]